jgi:hypothetical protein
MKYEEANLMGAVGTSGFFRAPTMKALLRARHCPGQGARANRTPP